MRHHDPAFLKIVSEVKASIKETDVAATKQKLDTQANFSLIDVREESEWGKGHIPTAIHLSKGVIERDIEKHIPDFNAEIVLYCGGGFRSALAAFNLQKMGYANVWSMDGGYGGWLKAGYSIDGAES